MNEKRIGAEEFALLKNFRGWGQPDRAVEQMLSGEPYPIKACWIQTTNMLGGQAADTRMHYEALKNMEFNVVVDALPQPHHHGGGRPHPAGGLHRREGEPPLLVEPACR